MKTLIVYYSQARGNTNRMIISENNSKIMRK